MDVFLPIAQVFVNPIEILLLSAIVGVLSGLFGVGGGFLMTPFLIFLGVPPAYAVANEANNILATSVSGSTTHYLKNTLDYKMGLMIVIGGTIGTALGIYTFTYFKGIGKIDTVISLAYMYILAIIGTLMLVESLREIDRAKRNLVVKKKLHVHYWIHGLPLRMRFPKSKLYESIFTPIIIGLEAEREVMYSRIEQRVDIMMNEGLLKEVESVFPHKNLNALQTVGYRELFDYLDDKITLYFAVEEIKKNTRRFAKRQLTWFKRTENTKWFTFPFKPEMIIKEIEKDIK